MSWALCHHKESLANGYRVDLPPGCHLHLVFHIEKIKHYTRSEDFLREVQPPPPVVVEDPLEYKVEDLIWYRGKGAHW